MHLLRNDSKKGIAALATKRSKEIKSSTHEVNSNDLTYHFSHFKTKEVVQKFLVVLTLLLMDF